MLPLPEIQGALIVGTAPQCGKTIVASGLAVALNDAGLRTEVFKPLTFKPLQRLRPDMDQAFYNKLLGQMESFQTLPFESAHQMTPVFWKKFLQTCRQVQYPVLIELPNNAAAPLMFHQGTVMDAADAARILNLPVIVATRKHGALLGELLPTLCYLQKKGIAVIGWAASECLSVYTPHWDEEVFYITQTYEYPYLGCIDYSPAISVELQRPGNILYQAQEGLDLLPVQMAMQLSIP